MGKLHENIRGLSAAPIVRTDEAPLTAQTTLLVAATKGVGFDWFPIQSERYDDACGPFLDVTEEVPKKGTVCPKCKGSCEEFDEEKKAKFQCSKCSGYGVLKEGQGVTIKRTVTWLFLADNSAEFDGGEWSPGQFWNNLADSGWLAANPNSITALVRQALDIGEEMKPSARIRKLEDEVLRPLPEDLRRKVFTNIIHVYRGLCWKLQAKEYHPEFQYPLERHILVRQGRSNAYLGYDWSEEYKLEKLKEYGMV